MVRTALLSQNAQPVSAMRAMPNVASPITPKLMTSSSDSRSPSTTRRMIVTPTSELIACRTAITRISTVASMAAGRDGWKSGSEIVRELMSSVVGSNAACSFGVRHL